MKRNRIITGIIFVAVFVSILFLNIYLNSGVKIKKQYPWLVKSNTKSNQNFSGSNFISIPNTETFNKTYTSKNTIFK